MPTRKYFSRFRPTVFSLALIAACASPKSFVSAHEAFVEEPTPQPSAPAGSTRLSSVTNDSAFTDEVNLILKQAIQETSNGELEAAAKTHEKLINVAPEVGYPRFARFLKLTNPAKLPDFSAALLADDSLPISLRARTLLTMDEADAATTLLEGAVNSQNGAEKTANTILLSTAYRKTNQPAKADQLIVQALRGLSPEDRRLLANHFFTRLGNPLPTSPSLLMTALDLGYIEMNQTTVERRELLDSILFSQQEAGAYFELRKALTTSTQTLGPVSLHLLVRLYLLEGRMEDASQLLGAEGEKFVSSSYYTELAKERVALFESTFQLDLALILSREIAEREQKSVEKPQQDFFLTFINSKQYEEALKIKPNLETALQEPRDRALIMGLIELAAFQKNVEQVVNLYAAIPKSVVREERARLHQNIFRQLVNTAEHLIVEQLIREQFRDNPDATEPALWLLAAAAAVESRLKPNEFEARYQYVRLAPNDTEELEALAFEAAAIALELSTATPEELEQFDVPQEEPKRFYELAEACLQTLIRSRPYAPEPMQQLIRLYRDTGNPEQAIMVPEMIAKGTQNLLILKNCGFVLSLEGYPELALEYYDKALQLDPANMDILTNRAAALTRLDRWDEAIEFYKSALEEGFQGKPWHNHEYILRLWAVAETLNQEAEMENYFKELAENSTIPWQDEILDNLAALFMKLNRPEDAAFYAHKILERELPPAQRLKIWEKLIAAFRSDSAKVEEYYTTALSELQASTKEYSALMINYSRYLKDVGRNDEAVQQLMKLNQTHTTAEALDAVFYAALIQEESGNVDEAKILYQQYLNSFSVNFTLRKEAEKRTSILTKSDSE